MDPLPEVSASSRKALVPKKAAKRLKAFLESTTPSVASQSDTGEEVLVCEVPEDTLLQLQRVYESISGKKRTLSFAPLFSFGQIEEESTNAASEDPLPHNPTKTVRAAKVKALAEDDMVKTTPSKEVQKSDEVKNAPSSVGQKLGNQQAQSHTSSSKKKSKKKAKGRFSGLG